MIEKVCVDSNILIYTLDPSRTAKTIRCEAWLNHLFLTGQIVLSPQAITETINVLVKKGLGIAEIRRLTLPFTAWITDPIDAQVVQRALLVFESYKSSWWDSLMIAWAAHAGCSMLLTEDRQSAPVIEGVAIISPFEIEPTNGLTPSKISRTQP